MARGIQHRKKIRQRGKKRRTTKALLGWLMKSDRDLLIFNFRTILIKATGTHLDIPRNPTSPQKFKANKRRKKGKKLQKNYWIRIFYF